MVQWPQQKLWFNGYNNKLWVNGYYNNNNGSMATKTTTMIQWLQQEQWFNGEIGKTTTMVQWPQQKLWFNSYNKNNNCSMALTTNYG